MDPHLPPEPPAARNPYEPPGSAPNRPRPAPFRPARFLGQLAGRLLVVTAALVAFVGTCGPLSLVHAVGRGEPQAASEGAWAAVPWVVGAICGLGTGLLMSWGIFGVRRGQPPPPTGEASRR